MTTEQAVEKKDTAIDPGDIFVHFMDRPGASRYRAAEYRANGKELWAFDMEDGNLVEFRVFEDLVVVEKCKKPAQIIPKVTTADIQFTIASEHYFTADDGVFGAMHTTKDQIVSRPSALGLITFCVLVTANGHTITGESHCQDPAKFDAQIGRDEARKDAINKLWPMVVYAARG